MALETGSLCLLLGWRPVREGWEPTEGSGVLLQGQCLSERYCAKYVSNTHTFFPAKALVFWPGGRTSYCPGAQSCTYHLIQCMYCHIVASAHTAPQQDPLPQGIDHAWVPQGIVPAWVWSILLASPLKLKQIRWVATPLLHTYPHPRPVLNTVLLPWWIQHNSYHVPLQQWSWLAWHFPQKLWSWRRHGETIWCSRNSWMLPLTIISKPGEGMYGCITSSSITWWAMKLILFA